MGKIYVVGLGPGNPFYMTGQAKAALQKSSVVVGYQTYLALAAELLEGKEVIGSGMTREAERCETAVKKALSGAMVSLVSSGDSGVYGMAGLLLQTVRKMGAAVDVEIVPGVTAALAAAACLGAPLMHDFVTISLSDYLTPWEKIEKRLALAGEGDFVVCLYNPKSRVRQDYIAEAEKILLRRRLPDTPVGIVKNAGREGQAVLVTKLLGMSAKDIDMFTTVIIGNSETFAFQDFMVTPRGYGGFAN